jgi:hypothetical protein
MVHQIIIFQTLAPAKLEHLLSFCSISKKGKSIIMNFISCILMHGKEALTKIIINHRSPQQLAHRYG